MIIRFYLPREILIWKGSEDKKRIIMTNKCLNTKKGLIKREVEESLSLPFLRPYRNTSDKICIGFNLEKVKSSTYDALFRKNVNNLFCPSCSVRSSA